MRTLSGACISLLALILISFTFQSCGDNLVEGPPAEVVRDAGNQTDRLHVAIRSYACGSDQVSLLAHDPGDPNPELYRQDRFEVVWTTGDGLELSNTIWLECLNDGIFTVEVRDLHTGLTGAGTIYL
ncbi:MAG: hypothetical protein R3301_18295 [Saprospiraceae bacterium]|nr:hypothetical protein [Saprospiraceae bacterium]